MIESPRIYCVDTSVFIQSYIYRHPPHVFPSLWNRVADLVAQGRFVSPRKVLDEIKVKDDVLHKWAKAQTGIFQPPSFYIDAQVTVIAGRWAEFFLRDTRKHEADPFVVAMALRFGYTVLSEERGGNDAEPRIPHMCKTFGVPHVNMIEMMAAEGWTF